MNRVKCETKNTCIHFKKKENTCVCVCVWVYTKWESHAVRRLNLLIQAGPVHEPQVRWNLTNKFHPKILSSFRMHIQRLLSYTSHLTLSPETYRNQLSFTTLDPCSLLDIRASNLFVSLYYIVYRISQRKITKSNVLSFQNSILSFILSPSLELERDSNNSIDSYGCQAK